VIVVQGKLAEALATYKASLAIREGLAGNDPGNAESQNDLSISYDNVGNVLMAQSQLDEALKAYAVSLAIARRFSKGRSQQCRLAEQSFYRLCEGRHRA
jgi:tetratricopeptide (TPR) repeat protein